MIVLAQTWDTVFRNTLAPWQWGLLALIPPAIIALYFLKLKRQPLEVPSTYLWKKSIEDLHVNSFWQRLRKNILLLLQLLVVALAMLALLRPGWQGTRLEGQRFIFLVDNSASMQATDVENTSHRLEEAKSQVGALVDQMESGMTAMIVSFADAPQVVQEFTDNRRLLRERLDTIQPTFSPTNLKGALELADGLANPGRITVEEAGIEVDVVEAEPATLFIFSDGRFEDVQGFSLGNLTPHYVPIGSFNTDNLAISGFATRRSENQPDGQQAFLQVTNFTDQSHDVVVELLFNGELLDAQRLEIPAHETRGVVFPLSDATAGALEAKLSYQLGDRNQDDLPLDDVAFASLSEPQPGRVLVVSPGNPALELSLATERAVALADIESVAPAYLSSQTYQVQATAGEFDLIIYDQCTPEVMPRANTVFIGRLPPDAKWSRASLGDANAVPSADDEAASNVPDMSRIDVPQIIDWNRGHPLLTHVELGNVLIVHSLLTQPPQGGTVLIDSTGGPIAAISPRESYQDVVLGFEIIGVDTAGRTEPKTDWPRRHSFPTFWLNTLDYLAGRTGGRASESVRPGEPIEIKVPGAVTEVTIRGPADTVVIGQGEQELFQFSDTQQPGVYSVWAQENLIRRFAVNLFDRDESNVRLQPSQDAEAVQRAADIRIGNIDVAATAGSLPSRKETWRLILMVALILLLVEWYIYNRRVYI